MGSVKRLERNRRSVARNVNSGAILRQPARSLLNIEVAQVSATIVRTQILASRVGFMTINISGSPGERKVI